MKTAMIAVAGLLLAAAPAMAQSNATVQGTQTAPGNASGSPSAQTPAGITSTTQVGPSTTPPTGTPTTTPTDPAAPK